jgi:hypothetical protein
MITTAMSPAAPTDGMLDHPWSAITSPATDRPVFALNQGPT